MGTTTNGQLCFGIMLEWNFEIPWMNDEYGWDFENWWLELKGFKEKYNYKLKKEFLKQNPYNKNIELVNYCHHEALMYIITLEKLNYLCWGGEPTIIDPLKLNPTQQQKDEIIVFCKKFLNINDRPKWYLSSYWG